MTLRTLPLLLLLALAGCGDKRTSEDRQLDEAAASIDVNAMDNKEAAE